MTGGATTSATITSLTNTTEYTIRVAATNATGDSDWSADATGTPAPIPTLTATNISQTTATLTMKNHTGQWYYKYTVPSGDTSCTEVSAGTSTARLTGLTASTSYTFNAYSDSNSSCSTELTTDATDAEFRTLAPAAPTLPAASVTVSSAAVTVKEGEEGSYTIVLASDPQATVTITPSSGDSTVATVSPDSLNFTTSNWDQPRTVTVSGVENDVDGDDAVTTIRHEVAGGHYDNVPVASVAVTVTDDDTRGVTVSTPALTVKEGATVTYTVVLNSEPTTSVRDQCGCIVEQQPLPHQWQWYQRRNSSRNDW